MNLVKELLTELLTESRKSKRLPYDKFMIERDRLVKLFDDYFSSPREVHPDRFTLELEAPSDVLKKLHVEFAQLPLKFGKVFGDFDVSKGKLATLENGPYFVGGSCNVGRNKLTSLRHAPKMVVKSFDADNNQLTSLEGSPENIGGDFNVAYNPLKTLKGFPKHVKGWVTLPFDKDNPYGVLKLMMYDLKPNQVYFEPIKATGSQEALALKLTDLLAAASNSAGKGRSGVLKLQTDLIANNLDGWSKYE